MNVTSTAATGMPLPAPTVLLYNQQGPALVPMTPQEVRADTNASTALKSARTTINWIAKHLGEAPFATPTNPVRIALQPNYNNAYWDGDKKLLTLGGGDGTKYKAFTSLDTVAHELIHARQSPTVGYSGESGAVTESVADLVAEVIDGGDWRLAADVFQGGFRDLATPKVSHRSMLQENPGIHALAGLSSLAGVRSAKVVGGTAMAQLWWNTAKALGDRPSLELLAQGTINSALKYWGAGTREAQAVRDAWVSVGVIS